MSDKQQVGSDNSPLRAWKKIDLGRRKLGLISGIFRGTFSRNSRAASANPAFTGSFLGEAPKRLVCTIKKTGQPKQHPTWPWGP